MYEGYRRPNRPPFNVEVTLIVLKCVDWFKQLFFLSLGIVCRTLLYKKKYARLKEVMIITIGEAYIPLYVAKG